VYNPFLNLQTEVSKWGETRIYPSFPAVARTFFPDSMRVDHDENRKTDSQYNKNEQNGGVLTGFFDRMKKRFEVHFRFSG
jgi:hypothetical protein